jgi:predicted Zn finger-like uncharacterized protein
MAPSPRPVGWGTSVRGACRDRSCFAAFRIRRRCRSPAIGIPTPGPIQRVGSYCDPRRASVIVESVIIECSSCHSKYQYDEKRFEGKSGKRIRCAKCQNVFEIHNPSYLASPPPSSGQEDPHDQTFAGRPRKTIEEPLPEEEIEKPRLTGPIDATPRLPKGLRLSLAIINGPDAGNVHRIEKPRITIGRAADISLNDTEASRQHAAVEVRDQLFLLEDLGSTNGTLIDGEKIGGLTELQNHSEFVVGMSTLMLIVTSEA